MAFLQNRQGQTLFRMIKGEETFLDDILSMQVNNLNWNILLL